MLDILFEDRGIGEGGREAFLNPDYNSLHDPLLLPDMEMARDRVIRAIKDKERITVFSDYDADGIPGAVVMNDFFKRIGYKNFSIYIPHRHDEGFGLNKEFVESCDLGLLITIDCGTADKEELLLAKERGIDVIVTDHHESSQLPEAFAIVNPKRKDSLYPFGDLCGSAVVFKLIQAILAKESFGQTVGFEKWSLDMVGIATLSDCVPLVGENRILAHFGLNVLRKSRRPGLLSLLRNLRIEQKYLTEDDVTFMITPRINAASRMGVPQDAFILLSTTDEAEGQEMALHLEKINQERKGVVASMVKEAKKHLSERGSLGEVIVVGNPEWRPALAGLVCNSLVEEYERPIFTWGRDGDGVIKGSCRSYNECDLFALMSSIPEAFIEFGGHKGAGGFSVTLEQLTTLETKLSEAFRALEPQLGGETAKYLKVEMSDISESLWQTVSQFAPFGTGNEKPIFRIENASIQSIKQFGKANEHLELCLGNGTKAISFFSSPSTYNLAPSASLCTLHANLEKSYFRNRPEIRLRIVKIEV